jgi:putative endonuclease
LQNHPRLAKYAMTGWVYMMSNRKNGTLYIGVTRNLVRRISEHRLGAVAGFTKRYALKRLVHVERHETIQLAIQREKTMKEWPRAWKARLSNTHNPDWRDLFDDIAK